MCLLCSACQPACRIVGAKQECQLDRIMGMQMEAFPLDVGFLLPPIAGDPAAAEDPGQAEAPPAATSATAEGDAAPALTALARQVLRLHPCWPQLHDLQRELQGCRACGFADLATTTRAASAAPSLLITAAVVTELTPQTLSVLQVRRTARRFEPSAMLSALRSLATLAAPPGSARVPPSSGAASAAADGVAGDPEAAAPQPAFVLPADVVDALASDIRVRHLQFSKLQRSEVCGRIVCSRICGCSYLDTCTPHPSSRHNFVRSANALVACMSMWPELLLLDLVQAAALLGQLAAARGVTLASVQAVARTAQL